MDATSFCYGLIAGAGLGLFGGSLLSVKIGGLRNTKSSKRTVIRDVSTHGDVAGGDIYKQDR